MCRRRSKSNTLRVKPSMSMKHVMRLGYAGPLSISECSRLETVVRLFSALHARRFLSLVTLQKFIAHVSEET